MNDESFFHTSNSWTPRCLPQVRSVIATKGFRTFYDAEASALATAAAGRRRTTAGRPQDGRRTAAGRPQAAAAGRRRRPPPQGGAWATK